MNQDSSIRKYRDRIRVLLIIYFFSEEFSGSNLKFVKLLKDEVRIQKIDFLIRYPDYLAYELLELADEGEADSETVQSIVKEIFQSNEPEIRKDEMERFFFGAWESIDDTISFLMARGLIFFESKKHTDGKVGQKYYYLTQDAKSKIDNGLSTLPTITWYIDRCKLIKDYFGNFTGKELRVNQYKHPEYKNTPFKEYIVGIEDKVRDKYFQLYNETL